MIENLPGNLCELLDNAAANFPEHGVGFVRHDHSVRFLAFPGLREKSLSILAGLQELGLMKGDKAILSLESGEEIIPMLWACFYGGIIPALLQPPVSFSDYNPAADKAARVFNILESPYVILSHTHAQNWQTSNIPSDRLIDIANLHGEAGHAFRVGPGLHDPALIQFSSGSTGDPKGVMLTHENILVNTADIIQGIALEPEDIAVNWMPLYHDMGLIGFHITPVFAGVTQYFINPVDFVKNPFLWLDMMSQKKCTISACPNFGQLLVNRHLGRKPAHHWDFSHLRILFNGAEPISVSTMKSFLNGLAPFGLNPVAMFPAYGLAEAALAVTFPDRLLETEIKTFQRQTLLKQGIAIETATDDTGGIDLVNLGTQLAHCEMRVTDDFNEPVADGHVGHVLVRGRNVTKGYFGNPEKTAATFAGDWLLTGDLGFVFEGNLYITGRSKDIIFINGINYYAHDLETIAMQVEGITHGKIVVAGSFDEKEGRDKLLVFIVGGHNDETRNLCLTLKNHFANKIGLTTDLFIPVRSADIPRTSSGKLQRYKMVERYWKGGFNSYFML